MPGPAFLDGDRVALRTIEESDLDFHQRAINDPRIWRPTDRPLPVNGLQEREFYEETVSDEDGIWLLVTVESERTGVVTFKTIDWQSRRAELGYWIHPDYQQQGYGTEAVELLVGYGFEQLGLHRAAARTFADNEPSKRLLEAVGFTQEGVERDGAFVDGAYADVLRYSLLESEYET